MDNMEIQKLELEAKQYGYKQYGNSCGAKEERKNCIEDFTAGATSKYVEKQKLEFAIEQLNKIQVNVFAAFAEFEVAKSASKMLLLQIKELEQQLKQYDKEI